MKTKDLDKKNFKTIDPEIKEKIKTNVMNYNTYTPKTSWTHLAGTAACLVICLSILTYSVYSFSNKPEQSNVAQSDISDTATTTVTPTPTPTPPDTATYWTSTPSTTATTSYSSTSTITTTPSPTLTPSPSVPLNVQTGNYPFLDYYYRIGYDNCGGFASPYSKEQNHTTYSIGSVQTLNYHSEKCDEDSILQENFYKNKKYNSEFFKSKFLLAIIVEENSGSIDHEVTSVSVKNNVLNININRLIPQGGTDDMKLELIVLELDSSLMLLSKSVNITDVSTK